MLTLLALLLASPDAGRGAAEEPPARRQQDADSPSPKLAASEPRPFAKAFAVERKPRAHRTQTWTKPRDGFAPRWESEYPELHFSRFLDLARPNFHPPKVRTLGNTEWQATLFHFATAVIADLREAITLACPAARCAPVLNQAGQRLAAFVRAGARAFTHTDRGHTIDHWNTWYGWRLESPQASFELGCTDVTESPEVICELDLDLGDGLVLSYAPKNSLALPGPDLAIRRQGEPREKHLGEIQFDRTYTGAPVVVIAGSALPSRPSE